jgi:hypothetical protein
MNTTIIKSWRDVLLVHPAADEFPRMSETELRELGADIKKNGLKSPIALWKNQKHFPPVLLDGRSRLDAMECRHRAPAGILRHRFRSAT